VLRTMRTGEFELAHISFSPVSVVTCTARTLCASRAVSFPSRHFAPRPGRADAN
jgi:hypothetical protein